MDGAPGILFVIPEGNLRYQPLQYGAKGPSSQPFPGA
jgi:hypothetical protein